MTTNGVQQQYLIFVKYTQEYLAKVTAYSKTYLSKIANGKREIGEIFIGVCSYTLNEPREELFRLVDLHKVSKVSLSPSP